MKRLLLKTALTTLCLVFSGLACAGDWDSDANIRSAVKDFQTLQESQGNFAVVQTIKKCYAGVKQQGPSKALEYCVAYDVADVETTEAFYEWMHKKYSYGLGAPEESSRPVGEQRMQEAGQRAGIADVGAYVMSVHNKAVAVLNAQAAAKQGTAGSAASQL